VTTKDELEASFSAWLTSLEGDGQIVVDAVAVLAVKDAALFEEGKTEYWLATRPGGSFHANLGLLHAGVAQLQDQDGEE
jgi:hypothetical protein